MAHAKIWKLNQVFLVVFISNVITAKKVIMSLDLCWIQNKITKKIVR